MVSIAAKRSERQGCADPINGTPYGIAACGGGS